MDQSRGSPRPVRRYIAVALVFGILEWGFLALVGDGATSHHEVLGVTGAGAALLAVVAGIAAGPLVGAAVALSGGLAYYFFLTDAGATAPFSSTLLAVILWGIGAVVAGLVAEARRREVAGREQALRRLLDAQRQSARLHARLEASLLPPAPFLDDPLDVGLDYQPSEQAMRLGGDFLDVMELDDRVVAFVIGDVSGHGPDAAALGATLRAGWQGAVRSGADGAVLLRSLEHLLERERQTPETLVTVCIGWIDRAAWTLTVALAGHPAPLVSAAGSVTVPMAKIAPPLGAAFGPRPAASTLRLPPSFDLLLYTDGVVERRGPRGQSQQFDDELLARCLAREWDRADGAASALARVLAAMRVRALPRREDDAAALLIAART